MCQMSKIRFSLYLVNEKQDSTFVFLSLEKTRNEKSPEIIILFIVLQVTERSDPSSTNTS